ncbi:MAG: hypothetical protein EXS10_10930 [Phycisphaerales bacterium]|nr:hypothetical protein [Phycisphaerales bacterium]
MDGGEHPYSHRVNAPATGPYRTFRRVGIFIIGGTVLLIGVALLVLPGPAFIVIPSGLAILAIEFAWAKRWLDKVKEWAKAAAETAKAKLKRTQ